MILAIKYNISYKSLLEHQSMNSLQLIDKISIDVDDLLKKNYLKMFNSESLFNTKVNFFKSHVYLVYQNNDQAMTKTEKLEKYKYNDLIDNLCRTTKRIMIQGDFGMGKSTLCKFITYSWASNEQLLDFKFVFFIKASNLNESRYPILQHTKYKEIDIIIKECFLDTLTEISRVIFETNINYEKYKILWIIDEYEGSLSNIPKHLQDVFKTIISNPYTILTSRNHPENFSYYQITGFSEDTQQQYIDFFFDSLDHAKNKHIKKSLLHFLRANHLISKLCLIPMYLEFICNIWLKKSSCEFENAKTSITALYQEIFMSMINKFLIEQERLQPNHFSTAYEISTRLRLPLLAIKKISFYICKQNLDIFTHEELEKHSDKLFNSSEQKELIPYLFDVILRLGIVSRNRNNFKFTDPSLKMFFAAKYLTDTLGKSTDLYYDKNFKTKFAWFIRNYKYIKNNDLLFSFVSGLLNSLTKNSDFSGSLFLKETTTLFWENIFNSNLDFIGINHICLLFKCLKEADCNITFAEKPEIKSYMREQLPNILQYIRLNNITGAINMFLSVFSDPNTIEIIISLDVLKDTINFIAHTDKHYISSILSNLLENCKPDHRKKILSLVNEKLSMISNIEDDVIGKYFAISRKEDESNNEKFLIYLLKSSNLKNKRAALEIILEQRLYNRKITMLLIELAADIDPCRSKSIREQILLIDACDKQQIINNEDIINDLIEMENMSCLCIDILYNIHGDTAEFLEILSKIYKKAISPSIINKIYSTSFNLQKNLETSDDFCSNASTNDNDMQPEEDADEYETISGYNSKHEYITNNYQSINWQTIFLDVDTLVKLEQKILNFLIDNSILLLNTPLINLINAYAETYPNNALLGIIIIRRIFFNCHQEVLTIKNNGIMVYDKTIIFLEVDSFKEGNYMLFINQFAKLFYDFIQENSFHVEHKKTSFTFEKKISYYESQFCRFKSRTMYICQYVELSEPNLTAKESVLHSEQSMSDEDRSTSSVGTLKKFAFEKQSDSKSQAQTPTKSQDSIVTTITYQRLSLRC